MSSAVRRTKMMMVMTLTLTVEMKNRSSKKTLGASEQC